MKLNALNLHINSILQHKFCKLGNITRKQIYLEFDGPESLDQTFVHNFKINKKQNDLAKIPQKVKKAKKANAIPKRPTVDQEPENVQEPENIQAPENFQEPEQAQNKARKPGTARKRKFPTKGPLDLISKGGKIITKRSNREIKKPSRFVDGVNENEPTDER